MSKNPVRIGIGGPVSSGKTALVDALCKRMREGYRLGVITNDVFTREDMDFLVRSQALSGARIIGVQTGGCPHTAIREDASMNFDELAVSRPWAAGDASYLGTTLMSGRSIDPGVAERFHAELGRLAAVRAAADRLDDGVLLVRLLAVSGAEFHEARCRIRDCSASL